MPGVAPQKVSRPSGAALLWRWKGRDPGAVRPVGHVAAEDDAVDLGVGVVVQRRRRRAEVLALRDRAHLAVQREGAQQLASRDIDRVETVTAAA